MCNQKFIYLLQGWEGSTADARVLRDSMNRPHGLRVPVGNYYLCDNGYTNAEGFLTPYKGVRYHSSDWGHGPRVPQNSQEKFNHIHSKARNVIERAFGLLKMRWAILRSHSFFPIKVQNRIIMSCALIHNFIRNKMSIDPMEDEVDDFLANNPEEEHPEITDENTDFVENIEPS
ncbi:hypothetical protein BUALT_Bualt01G0126900 [Buddleja alternifolia]|uniref:DDE Tnp4 domain-containing protein n=1 Tax=Buddleja alternifolia TaxID=168488 RepID=A0AAV6Y7L6_9LAMI|nr:hypothetical protein BUALT_Bualt01G0126900 [Buddleja alternifolia]